MAVTWSPVDLHSGTAVSGLSNGNLTADAYTSGTWLTKIATTGKKTGKWYWEIVTSAGTNTNSQVGVAAVQKQMSALLQNGSFSIGWRAGGALYSQGAQRISAATMVVTPENCTVGIAMDCDKRRIWLARNNTWVLSGDPANDTNPTVDNQWFEGILLYPAVSPYYAMTAKFASASFTYSAPSGFSALPDTSDYTKNEVARLPPFPRIDMVDGGALKLSGIVTRAGVAGRYKVRLHHKVSGRVIAGLWSGDDGAYVFDYLKDQDYYVVAFDHTEGDLRVADCVDVGIVLEPV